MDFKVTMQANARELANALIVLDENLHRIKTDEPVIDKLVNPKPESAAKPQTAKPAKVAPKEVVEEEPEAEEEKAPASDIDLETIRKMVIAKTGDHKPEIAALLKTFKAKTLPDLATSDYASFYEQLSAL